MLRVPWHPAPLRGVKHLLLLLPSPRHLSAPWISNACGCFPPPAAHMLITYMFQAACSAMDGLTSVGLWDCAFQPGLNLNSSHASRTGKSGCRSRWLWALVSSMQVPGGVTTTVMAILVPSGADHLSHMVEGGGAMYYLLLVSQGWEVLISITLHPKDFCKRVEPIWAPFLPARLVFGSLFSAFKCQLVQ